MGLYDRSYYQDDASSYEPESSKGWSAVTVIIVINAIIFFADAFTNRVSDDGMHWLAQFMALKVESRADFADFGSAIGFYLLNSWQLLTYGFAHASVTTDTGIFHIAFNMVSLFFLGRFVEQVLGRAEFVKFYLVALLFSGLTFVIFRNLINQPSDVVGASGGVMAVVMLLIVKFPHMKLAPFGVGQVPAWIIGVILIVLDLYGAINPNSKTAVDVHFAGMAFAAAYHFLNWNFRWLPLERVAVLFNQQPRMERRDPSMGLDKLKREADEILEKVHEQGEASLSRRERKTLEKYSRTVRDQRK